jgi:DNA-binding response OmpR family regulator
MGAFLRKLWGDKTSFLLRLLCSTCLPIFTKKHFYAIVGSFTTLDWIEKPMPDPLAKVLLIEDQSKIARWLVSFLEEEQFEVVSAINGVTGLALARAFKPDIILLDLQLPDIDGLEVCRALRQESDVYIIMATARIEEADRLLGLEMGADDYVTKPYSPKEIAARIRAYLRRLNRLLVTGRSNPTTTEPPLICGELTLDSIRHLCTLSKEAISLTPTEFAILETLMRHPGIPYTRERLISEALGYDYAGYERTIDVHVRNLRRKIEVDPQTPRYILTVFGVGYRFAEE